MTDDPEVRALSARIRAVQPKWHAEAITEAARSVVAYDRAYGMALDSANPGSLDAAISRFFHGDQAMPAPPPARRCPPAATTTTPVRPAVTALSAG